METLEISKKNNSQSNPSYFGTQKEDDIPDMEEFEESNNIESNHATLQPTYLVAHEPDDDNILRTRTYDVSITYDKYCQTPRVWLTGYDEGKDVFEAFYKRILQKGFFWERVHLLMLKSL